MAQRKNTKRLNTKSNVNTPAIILGVGGLMTIAFTADSFMQHNSPFITVMIFAAFAIGTYFAYKYSDSNSEFADRAGRDGVVKTMWRSLFKTKTGNNSNVRRRRNIRNNRR